ncbi:MAG TPA: hypothetical protein VN915_12350 [Elusimicrobiota bacterium]|nr:hypothetical protein [Elusimicrobiota bacterium]
MSEPGIDARGGRRRFGVLCVLGYVALSWAMLFDMRRGPQCASLVYPLDTFSMYAQIPAPEVASLVLRDANGGIRRIKDMRSYECEDPLSGPEARCAGAPLYRFNSDALLRYVRKHKGPGALDAELLVRTFALKPGEAPVQESECVLSRCKVSP